MLLAARHDAGPVLGREAELELLTALLGGIRSQGAALVWLGEPGIGRSRLLAETEGLACERDIVVLCTSGVRSEAHVAVLGLPRVLRPLRTRTSGLTGAQRAALDGAFGVTG